MKEAIERMKRKVTCDPKKDKKCKCKDYLKIGHENGRPIYGRTRICERDVD